MAGQEEEGALVKAIGDGEASNQKDPDLCDDLTFRDLSRRNWAVRPIDGINLSVIPARAVDVASDTEQQLSIISTHLCGSYKDLPTRIIIDNFCPVSLVIT